MCPERSAAIGKTPSDAIRPLPPQRTHDWRHLHLTSWRNPQSGPRQDRLAACFEPNSRPASAPRYWWNGELKWTASRQVRPPGAGGRDSPDRFAHKSNVSISSASAAGVPAEQLDAATPAWPRRRGDGPTPGLSHVASSRGSAGSGKTHRRTRAPCPADHHDPPFRAHAPAVNPRNAQLTDTSFTRYRVETLSVPPESKFDASAESLDVVLIHVNDPSGSITIAD